MIDPSDLRYMECIKILSEHSYNTSNIKISDQTRIAEDLYITGDAVLTLLEALSEKFGTNFDGFPYSEYFPCEVSADHNYLCLYTERSKFFIIRYFDLLFAYFWWMFSSGKKYKALFVKDLWHAIERGEW